MKGFSDEDLVFQNKNVSNYKELEFFSTGKSFFLTFWFEEGSGASNKSLIRETSHRKVFV